jgi:multiple sugar transport system substrate-binding protein
MRSVIISGMTVGALLAGTCLATADTLSVWWVKGFYKAEDDALDVAIEKFQKETGATVDLVRIANKDIRTKVVAAVEAGTPPDLAVGDLQSNLNSQLAFEGKLVDLTDVIEPQKDQFNPAAFKASYLLDGATGKRGYYSFPIDMQIQGVFYWKDMLGEAGFKESDIPTGWDDYWSFWCDKVQPALQAKGHRVYGVGMTYGPGNDTVQALYLFLDAYNVKLLDDDGKPRLDQPDVRENLIKAMTSFTSFAIKGCSPSSSINWTDPDNNQYFHSRQIAMTVNNSISIPGKWLDDSQNETKSAEERKTALDNYQNKVGTTAPPQAKPDASPLTVRSTVNAGIVFKAGKNPELAKKFVSFLLKDENVGPYVEGTLGRYFPVKSVGIEAPFWREDGHRQYVYDNVKAGTGINEFSLNHKFTLVNNQGLWQKAAGDIITNGVAPEKAVDDLLAEMKRILQ